MEKLPCYNFAKLHENSSMEGNAMKRLPSLLLALALCAALPVCSALADSLKSVTTYITNRVETWNILYTQDTSVLKVLINLTDPLTTYDASGKLTPNAASSYQSSADGMTWTFHLRRGMRWYDHTGAVRGSVTAQDWLVGLEWVLNFYKNYGSNTSFPTEFIVGAEDYYEYTAGLQAEAARGLRASGVFSTMVGIEAPDDYTLVYHLTRPVAAFPSIVSYNCFCPLSQALADNQSEQDWDDMWSCGPYIVTDVDEDDSVTLAKSPGYWNTAVSRFDTLRFRKLNNTSEAYELFLNGEVDQATLSPDNVLAIYNDPDNEYHDCLVETRPTKYSYEIHFCYAKKNADGTYDTNWNRAVANESFRKALYYGMDMTDYLAGNNPIHPLSGENYTSVVPGTIVNSAGVDYTDMVLEHLGLSYGTGSYSRYNAELALQYKQQAMTALAAKGVTFPVHAAYYVRENNTTSLEQANVLANVLSSTLGSDFIVMDVLTYQSNFSYEVRNRALASFYTNGWGLDYPDPGNYLGTEVLDDDAAYFSNAFSLINRVDETESPELIAAYREFSRLVAEADAIIDNDARMEAFAVAEAYLIDHALVIPAYLQTSWELTRVNSLSTSSVGFGSANYRWVDILSSDTPYTQEQMQQEIQARQEERQVLLVRAAAIEQEAFRGIGAKTVELADSCRSVGPLAFADCAQLRKVIIPAAVRTIHDSAFDGCADFTIYCTPGSAADGLAARKGFSVVYILPIEE